MTRGGEKRSKVTELLGVDETMLLTALGLISVGAYMVWAPAGLLAPGAVLLWIFLPQRTTFLQRPPARSDGPLRARERAS